MGFEGKKSHLFSSHFRDTDHLHQLYLTFNVNFFGMLCVLNFACYSIFSAAHAHRDSSLPLDSTRKLQLFYNKIALSVEL